MKKIILLLTVLIGLFTGCETAHEPHASFNVSYTSVYTYEEIAFYNYSEGSYFEWDFGDGYTSTIFQPTHSYSQPGIYTVSLAAYHGDMVDYAYMNIEVIEAAASLNIQVLEYSQGYTVGGARIIIYPTLTDWTKETNPVATIYTNNNGIAVIDGLYPGYYYLDIWETNHNNYTLANDDVNFIKTPLLVNYATTYFDAYVDYVPSSQSSLKDSSTSRRDNILKTTTKRVYSEKLNTRK